MKKILFALATLLFIGSWMNRALAWEGKGTEADPYLIQNTLDWDTLSIKTNAGETAAGIYFKLTGDISAKVCVGTSEHPFQGNFDGGGFTIAATLTASSGAMAPFAYIQNATVSHLKVTGIIDGGWYAAGVVGEAKAGVNVIEDCHASATINAQKQTGNYAWVIGGGILGNGASSTVNIRGCLFDGRIKTDASIERSYAGAIVGWCEDNADIRVSDCLENATSNVSPPYSEWIRNIGMVFKNGVAQDVKESNNYSLAHTWTGVNIGYKIVNLSDELEIVYLTDGHTYPTTGIEPITGGNGMLVNGTCYAASGNTVTFQGTYPSGYTGILNCVETALYYDVTMPEGDVYLSLTRAWQGSGTKDDPYRIENAADWQQLAAEVKDGNTHSGKYFQLVKDISAYMPVGDEAHAFSGKLDGGGHTLTASLKGGDYTAPFVSIQNAELSHLHVAGIVEGGLHAAGIAGFSEGTNVITDCRMSASVVANSTHAGGFIGHAKTSTTTLKGCRMDGFVVNRGQLQYAGFFFGWSEGTAQLSLHDCLCTGTSQGAKVDLSWSYTYGQNPAAACGTVSNTYHNGMLTLGSRYYTITTGSPVLQLDFGLIEGYYPTSDLQSYAYGQSLAKGLQLGELYVAGAGEKVNFAVNTATGFTFSNLTTNSGTLNNNSGRYVLTLGSADAVLSASIASTGTLQGSGTEGDPYLIERTSDWMKLSVDVAGGRDYAGKVFRMTRDVDTNGMMVGASGKPFRGTFDGDGYTLTFNAGQLEKPVGTQLTAPFVEISGATIRHLKTTGSIYTNAKFAAGIAARVSPSAATRLFDCSSDMSILSFIDGDGSHGGLIAEVNGGVDSLVIENSSFTGHLLSGHYTTHCGGFVGWASTKVIISNSVFDPQGRSSHSFILDGSTFARMDTGKELSLTDCYTTMQMNTHQGTFIFSDIDVPNGVSYEFQDAPVFIMNDKQYYTTGCHVAISVPEGLNFDHWVDEYGCFISDPWTAEGIHQLKDLHSRPSLRIDSRAIPSAETERTLWGVTYRYLSRRDYHFFISDEDREAMGWDFENDDSDANLVVYTDGNASEITAVTGYKESSYNSDGVQIHNDLVGVWRNHTHLGMIAPHAFKNSTALTSLYFKDTDANNYNARTAFKFFIGEGAFEGCSNFEELKMMQYTTKGTNSWQALTPDQVISVADDAFTDCPKLNISAQADKYQDYMSSETWKQHRSRFIIYEATTNDFTVNGVKYHYYRNFSQSSALKNDESGKSQMMDQIRFWNAAYQQFSASSLLETKSGCNVYYTSIVGVDDSDIDDKSGTMRIYNDPGSYYNYKTIQLGRDAIAGNTHVKKIEFYQTNGRSANSYSDLKMVIPNGAFKGCKNLCELNMYIYVEDGDNHWETLGPEDVIPGDNIFGILTEEEYAQMTQEEYLNAPTIPVGFKIVVSPARYNEFIDDPNWQPYVAYIEPADYEPTNWNTIEEGGLTYDYASKTVSTASTNQIVTQRLSWWNLPIKIYEIYSLYKFVKAGIDIAKAYAQLDEVVGEEIQAWTIEKGKATIRLSEEMERFDFLNQPENYSKIVSKNINEFVQRFEGTAQKLVDLGLAWQARGNIGWTEQALELLTTNEEVRQSFFETWLETIRYTHSQTIVELNKQIAKCYAETDYFKYLNMGKSNLATGSLATSNRIVSHLIGNAYSCYQGLNGEMTDEQFQLGLVENMKANIHNVSYENTLVYTPEKKLIYHMYVKSADASRDSVTIYNDIGSAWNYRTVAIRKDVFRGNTNLKKVGFAENAASGADSYVPLQLAIPDSAFAGCTGLRRFNLIYKTRKGGFRGLGPENFILGGDSIFAGCDSTQLQIVIAADRKQSFLDDEIWSKYKRFFVYEDVKENVDSSHDVFGVGYAYAYDGNTTRRTSKISGHTIEHMEAVRPNVQFLSEHQGSMGLCNDIGVWNNYKLDRVKDKAFAGCDVLRTVSFWDLDGWAWTGDTYTTLDMQFGDECFANCPNLANIDMLYCITDGDNHLEPLKPTQVRAGKNMFDNSPNCIIKMLPQQVAWYEADSAWAAYKDRFRPCIIRPGDEKVKDALKSMAYYTPCASPSKWENYIDIYRIAGAGWSWLNGKLSGKDIRSFSEFKYFECAGLDYIGDSWFSSCSKLSNIGIPSTIKRIEGNAFKGCGALREVELPASLEQINEKVFAGCGSLKKIVLRAVAPPELVGDEHFTISNDLKIYVPAASVAAYKQAWPLYADYIVSDATNKVNKRVVVPQPGKLAEELGLTIETSYLFLKGQQMEYLHGNYAQYDSLTVSGTLNGLDLAVLRYLSGEDSRTKNGRHTDGQLRYLNLADASFIKDTDHPFRVSGGFLEWRFWMLEEDNELSRPGFMNCDMLETVILPKSLKNVKGDLFKGCSSLKHVAVLGDGMGFGQRFDFLVSVNYPLLDNPLEELVYLTDNVAAENGKDAWGQDIMNVYVRKSQLADYMDIGSLTSRAQNLEAPFKDDAVMEALANHEEFFPSLYFAKENVEGLFVNSNITRFDDFYKFQNVKQLESTFSGNDQLRSIILPMAVEYIGHDAFQGCERLDTIQVLCDSVPELAAGAFASLPTDFVILVPKDRVKRYREQWEEYADHINPAGKSTFARPLITVTLTEPNTLAEKLGLKVTEWDEHTLKWDGNAIKFIKKLSGEYGHITRLKVCGPISGSDFAVLRHLAGYTPWNDCRNYLGHLEYIDLYDAQVVPSYHDGSSDKFYEYLYKPVKPAIVEEENVMPPYSLLKCYSLKTLILPRTVTKVEERAIQECENLEILTIGDDCVDFNWNALDDDVSLIRLYILAKKKPELSSELFVWRWLCNNYNPTFDAFYVRPSLYEQYAYDSNYTGNSWQRTNNVTVGGFTDDEAFCAFGSHAAACLDDLKYVFDVNGWFDNHTGIRDLTALGYTSIDTLHASDITKLAKLERIELPMTLTTIEEGAFAQSPELRYVDMLMCDSTMIVDDIRTRGLSSLGIDNSQTLVYLPDTYGTSDGTNIVVNDGVKMTAETFRLVDGKDYCIPYTFVANAVENSRVVRGQGKPYASCLPYELTLDLDVARVYKPTDREGSMVTFLQVADGKMEAFKPYVVRPVGQQATFNVNGKRTIKASKSAIMGADNEWDVPGYTMRGTLSRIDNKTADEMEALILVDGTWQQVPANNEHAYIAPFRAYMLQSANGGNAPRQLTMSFLDDEADGIDTIRTIDLDGTEHYYDLNGRELPGKPEKGIFIHNGKKYIAK